MPKGSWEPVLCWYIDRLRGVIEPVCLMEKPVHEEVWIRGFSDNGRKLGPIRLVARESVIQSLQVGAMTLLQDIDLIKALKNFQST